MTIKEKLFKFFTFGFAAIGIFTTLLVGGFIFLVFSLVSGFHNNPKNIFSGSQNNPRFEYSTYEGTGKYFAGIKLNSEINDKVAEEIIDKFETALSDKKSAGILFEIDSPGGAVVPSQEIYDEVTKVRAKKPVVAYIRSLDASGAFYSSINSTKIVANRGSLIGSIGVIMQGMEANKLIEFLKLNPVTLKTGALKDAGSPMRPMNENDKKYLQELIEETRKEFVNDVKKARKIDETTLKFMSDGRVILAPKALELKLIDSIGTREVALDELRTLSKTTADTNVFYFDETKPFGEFFSQKIMKGMSDGISQGVKETLNFKNFY